MAPPQQEQLTASQILINDAATFNLMVQDPEGMNVQNSKIIVSGGKNDTPLTAQNGLMMPAFAHPHPEQRKHSINNRIWIRWNRPRYHCFREDSQRHYLQWNVERVSQAWKWYPDMA